MLIIWPPDDHGVITTTPSPKPQNETKERRRPRNRRPRPSPGQSRSRPPGQRRPFSPLDPTKHRHPGPRTINRRSDRIGAGGFGDNRRIGHKTLFNAEDSTIESEVLRGHRAEGGGRRQRRSHLHVSSQEWSLIHIFARIIFIDFAVYDWFGPYTTSECKKSEHRTLGRWLSLSKRRLKWIACWWLCYGTLSCRSN